MASLLKLTKGEGIEFDRVMAAGGVDEEFARAVMLQPDLVPEMVAAVRGKILVHGLFTRPENQIRIVRGWNKEFGWGLPDVCFQEATQCIPDWPEDHLVAVTLVPYLKDQTKDEDVEMTGLERTFQQLWARAKAGQEASLRWDGYDKAGPDRLRLLSGIEHKPGLRWEVIDFGCQRNCKPKDVRKPEESPHAGVLASAALHPNWVKAMDGSNVPFVFAPGYEVNVPDRGLWQGVPGVRFGRGGRQVELCAIACGLASPYWAVPRYAKKRE